MSALDRAVSDDLVAAGLANADVSDSGTGWVVLDGSTTDRAPLRERPQMAVTLQGGGEGLMLHGGGQSTAYARVQVVLRGVTNDYADARDKAVAVRSRLHARTLTLTGGADALLRAEGYPIWLGYTEQDRRPLWSLNFMTSIL